MTNFQTNAATKETILEKQKILRKINVRKKLSSLLLSNLAV